MTHSDLRISVFSTREFAKNVIYIHKQSSRGLEITLRTIVFATEQRRSSLGGKILAGIPRALFFYLIIYRDR